jgi:hypothetical protein
VLASADSLPTWERIWRGLQLSRQLLRPVELSGASLLRAGKIRRSPMPASWAPLPDDSFAHGVRPPRALYPRVRVPARVPERQHFDYLGFFLDAVIEIVPDAAQMNATCSGKLCIRSKRSDARLSGDESEGPFNGITECFRGGWSIQIPPFGGLPDFPGSTAGEPQGKR